MVSGLFHEYSGIIPNTGTIGQNHEESREIDAIVERFQRQLRKEIQIEYQNKIEAIRRLTSEEINAIQISLDKEIQGQRDAIDIRIKTDKQHFGPHQNTNENKHSSRLAWIKEQTNDVHQRLRVLKSQLAKMQVRQKDSEPRTFSSKDQIIRMLLQAFQCAMI